jgi:hypothetical protein
MGGRPAGAQAGQVEAGGQEPVVTGLGAQGADVDLVGAGQVGLGEGGSQQEVVDPGAVPAVDVVVQRDGVVAFQRAEVDEPGGRALRPSSAPWP